MTSQDEDALGKKLILCLVIIHTMYLAQSTEMFSHQWLVSMVVPLAVLRTSVLKKRCHNWNISRT